MQTKMQVNASLNVCYCAQLRDAWAVRAGCVAKSLVLLNANQAPWKQGDFLRQKGELLTLAMQSMVTDGDWFASYCESMCYDQGLSYDADPQILLEKIMSCKSFTQTGTAVRGFFALIYCACAHVAFASLALSTAHRIQ